FFPPPSTLTHTLAYVTATTAIYTLSLHDALPISPNQAFFQLPSTFFQRSVDWIDFTFFFQLQVTLNSARIISFSTPTNTQPSIIDRKSTRLNSSHVKISYAVFCLKKKKIQMTSTT